MLTVELSHSCETPPLAFLRPLTGQDENATRGSGLAAALALAGRLLVPSDGTLGAAGLSDLSMASFDRIMAALQRDLYGDTLDCRSKCRECGEAFEFSVALDQLIANSDDDHVRELPGRKGWFETKNGTVFRLPRVGEVLRKTSADTLMQACAGDSTIFANIEEADAAFAAAGPLACETINTACPHCTTEQSVALDLVDYLTEMLARERPFLVYETHCIARAYGWGLKEIHSLPRDDRRDFVRLIGQEKSARRIT